MSARPRTISWAVAALIAADVNSLIGSPWAGHEIAYDRCSGRRLDQRPRSPRGLDRVVLVVPASAQTSGTVPGVTGNVVVAVDIEQAAANEQVDRALSRVRARLADHTPGSGPAQILRAELAQIESDHGGWHPTSAADYPPQIGRPRRGLRARGHAAAVMASSRSSTFW